MKISEYAHIHMWGDLSTHDRNHKPFRSIDHPSCSYLCHALPSHIFRYTLTPYCCWYTMIY